MLAAKYRLKAEEIPLIARKGRRLGNNQLELRFLEDKALNIPKIGIIAPKKVANLAVERNLIKRRIRASLIDLVKQDKLKPGKYLFLARSLQLTDKNLDISQLILSILV
jgi:ribonuclease P protein component